jgi:hypothetical protein
MSRGAAIEYGYGIVVENVSGNCLSALPGPEAVEEVPDEGFGREAMHFMSSLRS